MRRMRGHQATPIKTHLRVVLASCSVAVIATVNATAAAVALDDARPLLLLCSVVALGAAVQSAAWNPAVLTSGLLFSLPPVIALLAGDGPTWLIGPLGALLLVGAELNALSWQCRGGGLHDVLARRRLWKVGQLGVLGLAASLVVAAAASGPSPGGTPAIVIAAIALAALAYVMFGRGT